MPNTWLIEALPERFEVTERHRLTFDIGNNDQSQQLSAEIDAIIRIPVDGNLCLKRRSLERAVSARNEGGLARLGILGLAAAEFGHQDQFRRDGGQGTVAAILEQGLDESNPLHQPPDGSVVTWALDLPSGLETNVSKLPAGAEDLVYVFRIHLPISPPKSYPVTLGAELRVLGDDLPRALERLTSEKDDEIAQEVKEAISHQVRDRSVFCVVLGINLSALHQGTKPAGDLVRVVLDWLPGGDGSEIMLGRLGKAEVVSQLVPGCYDPVTGQIEFLLPKSFCPVDQYIEIILIVPDPTVLSSMDRLKGAVEIEIAGLMGGLRPFMANTCGKIVAGLGAENSPEMRDIFSGKSASSFDSAPGFIQRTTLTADFNIRVSEKFRGRPVAQQMRLQFPGRRFRDDQLRQVTTLFRDFAFPDPAYYAPSEKSGPSRHLLCARRTVGGDKQHLVFQIVSEKRSVDLEVHLGTTTETRTEPLDDIAVDIAAVGPNHDGISKLMADLQPRVMSLLGVR